MKNFSVKESFKQLIIMYKLLMVKNMSDYEYEKFWTLTLIKIDGVELDVYLKSIIDDLTWLGISNGKKKD